MAFEWKWQPTLDEELSRKARASMEGYRPLSNPSNTFAMAYGNGAGPTVAQLAANGMAGYTSPSSAMNGYVPSRTPDAVPQPAAAAEPSFGQGGAGGAERARMWGANNYGQGMAYTERMQAIEDLKTEQAENEQRIEQLKMELVKLQGEAGRAMDELDMRLAANRANAGDIASAMAHQNRITTRQQIAAANGGKTADDKIAEDLVASFIDTESAMMMGDNSQRPGFQNKLDFIQYQINKNPKAKQLLEKFRGSNVPPKIEQPRSFQDFTNYVSDKRTANAGNAVKKNGLTKADKEDIAEYWYSLPKEVRAANKEEFNKIIGEDDIESIQARGKALRAKQKTALDEAKLHIIPTELDEKGSQEYTATNGQKVTIKRSGFGKAVLTIGKLVENVNY